MARYETEIASAAPQTTAGAVPTNAQTVAIQPGHQTQVGDPNSQSTQTAAHSDDAECLDHISQELLTLMYSLSVRIGFERRIHASDLPNSKDSTDALNCLLKQKIVKQSTDGQWYTVDLVLARKKLHRLATWRRDSKTLDYRLRVRGLCDESGFCGRQLIPPIDRRF